MVSIRKKIIYLSAVALFVQLFIFFGMGLPVFAMEDCEEEVEVDIDAYDAKFAGSSGMCSLQVVDMDTGSVLDSVSLSVSGIDTSKDQTVQQKNLDWSKSNRIVSGYGGVSESKTFKKEGIDKYYLGVVGTYIVKPAGYYICDFRKVGMTDLFCTPFKPGSEYTINSGTVKILTSDGSNKATMWDESRKIEACNIYFSMLININEAMINNNAVAQIMVKKIPYSVTYNTAGHNGNATSGTATRQDYTYGSKSTVPSADSLGIERHVTQVYDYNNSGMGKTSEKVKLPFSYWSSLDNTVVGSIGNGTDPLCVSYGSNLELYANWGQESITLPSPAGNTYTITYDTRGGSAVSDSSGTQVFSGWVSGDGSSFAPGESVSVGADNTFVGQWTDPTLNLKSAPEKRGYTFKGWSVGSTIYGAEQPIVLSSGVTAAAVWEANTYTITYDINGGQGEFTASQTLTYDTDGAIISEKPVRIDHEFLGWSEKSNATYGEYAPGQSIKNLLESGNMTLYAVWKEIEKPAPSVENPSDQGNKKTDVNPGTTEVHVITEKIIDEEKLEDILKRLEKIASVNELTASELKELINEISNVSGLNKETTEKLIDLISRSKLSEVEKMRLIKHLTNGYLTEEDRRLISTVISQSNLTESEKNSLYESIKGVSTVTLEKQKEIVNALNSGSQALYTTSDGVSYILTKNSDGSLSVALKSLSGVKDLVIPNQLSFAGITYPVTSIARDSFKGNKELRSVTIPSNITTIGASAFENCTSLLKVTTTNGLVSIGDKAFMKCIQLKEFVCPKTLKSIGNSAFQGCIALKKITFNSGLLQIGNKAFSGCKALKSITLPKSILKLGASAFANCTALKKITFKGGKSSSLVSLGNSVFSGCKSLQKILIPSKLAVIPKNAFKNCAKLKSVTGMKKVGEIGISAFEGCEKLPSFTLTSRVTKVGRRAFYGCHNLSKLNVKTKSLVSVGKKVFYYCSKNLSFTYPKEKVSDYEKLFKNKR